MKKCSGRLRVSTFQLKTNYFMLLIEVTNPVFNSLFSDSRCGNLASSSLFQNPFAVRSSWDRISWMRGKFSGQGDGNLLNHGLAAR